MIQKMHVCLTTYFFNNTEHDKKGQVYKTKRHFVYLEVVLDLAKTYFLQLIKQ